MINHVLKYYGNFGLYAWQVSTFQQKYARRILPRRQFESELRFNKLIASTTSAEKKSPSRLLHISGAASLVSFFSSNSFLFLDLWKEVLPSVPENHGCQSEWSEARMVYTFCRRPGMFQTCSHNFPLLWLDSGKSVSVCCPRRNRNFKRAVVLDKFGFPNNPGNQKYKYPPKKTRKVTKPPGIERPIKWQYIGRPFLPDGNFPMREKEPSVCQQPEFDYCTSLLSLLRSWERTIILCDRETFDSFPAKIHFFAHR